MSFASDVKQEITRIDMSDEEIRALLSAYLQINGDLVISNKQLQILIETNNAMVAKYIYTLLKKRYSIEMELSVINHQRFKKENTYTIKVLEKGDMVLEDVGIYSHNGLRPHPYSMIVVKERNAKSYLMGAFLASGSINDPIKPNYHLEIGTHEIELAQFIQKIIGKFEIESKIFQRRNKYIVYIKKADQIADFLKIIGAFEATMSFEDVRIQRDFRNSLTRLDNCEVANEMKSIKAGNEQLDAIYKLIEYNRYHYLDKRLIDVAEIRMDNPEGSLNELISEFERKHNKTISKSGLQHRLKKLIDIASQIED